MNRQAQRKLASTVLAVGLLLSLAIRPAPAAEPATLELVGTIALKGAEGRLDHLALDREHARLFVANLSNDSLDIVDLKAGKLIKQIPDQKKIQGIAYAPDLDRIYVGNGTSGECNVFDGKDYKLLKSIKLPGADNVRYLARRRLVYVGHAEKALSAIDARTFEVKAEILLPGRPEGFQLETKRPRLYMNTVEPTRLVVIDTDKNEVRNRYPLKLADRAYPMAVDEPIIASSSAAEPSPRLWSWTAKPAGRSRVSPFQKTSTISFTMRRTSGCTPPAALGRWQSSGNAIRTITRPSRTSPLPRWPGPVSSIRPGNASI
jgi:hypothetical protein